LELPFLKHAQELRLEIEWHIADFVQKKSSSVRLLEPANAALDGAREGASDVSEQFGFQQVIGECGAIDGYERGVAARSGEMQGGCRQFLTRPGLARDEDGRATAADHSDDVDNLTNGRTSADQEILPIGWAGGPRTKRPSFGRRAGCFDLHDEYRESNRQKAAEL
jgi:hypothetical protein